MSQTTLARAVALGVALALVAGCSREEPTETVEASVANETGDAPAVDTPPAPAPPAELLVQQGWTRAVPPNAPVAAGYLTLVNGTRVDDRLVEVRSEAAERVEIHEMRAAGDGTMQMREVEGGLPLPGGISVDLRPGGLHLMFFAPDAARWQAGAHIPVTLVFEGVGEREVDMEVYAPGDAPAETGVRMRGPGEGDDHHHGDMEHGQDDDQGRHEQDDDAPVSGNGHHGH